MDQILAQLREFSAPNVFNPWMDVDPMDMLDPLDGRRLRLMQHFNCNARFLLVGEAPGYQGCHFTAESNALSADLSTAQSECDSWELRCKSAEEQIRLLREALEEHASLIHDYAGHKAGCFPSGKGCT